MEEIKKIILRNVGIEVKLYNSDRNGYCVRQYDVEAEEVIEIRIFRSDLGTAEKYFKELVKLNS